MKQKICQSNTSTKEKILDAAIDLFSQKGFYETSVREIAKLVGIKDCSLYSHFISKEEILDTILASYQSEMEKMWRADQTLDDDGPVTPELLLNQAVSRFKTLNKPTRMDKIVKILLLEMYRNDKVRAFYFRWKFNDYRQSVTGVFQELREKGVIRDLDPDFLALMYQALANYFYQEFYFLKAGAENGVPPDEGRPDIAAFEAKIRNQYQMFLDLIKR